MTKNIACVDPETVIEEAMAIMTQQRCRHLPVIENGSLAGIVSVGDLVKHVARDREAPYPLPDGLHFRKISGLIPAVLYGGQSRHPQRTECGPRESKTPINPCGGPLSPPR